MAEHRTQLGLPAREDYIFVAKALSQVNQSEPTKICANNLNHRLMCYISQLQIRTENNLQIILRISPGDVSSAELKPITEVWGGAPSAGSVGRAPGQGSGVNPPGS